MKKNSSNSSSSKCWATLKKIAGDDDQDDDCSRRQQQQQQLVVVSLTNLKYTLGRSTDCDLSFTENRYLSGKHATIEFDSQAKIAWLIDSSTNGTILNLKEKIHRTRHKLENGDKIYFVLRKNEPDKLVAYEFEYANNKQEKEAKAVTVTSIDLMMNETLAYDINLNLERDLDAEKMEEKRLRALQMIEKLKASKKRSEELNNDVIDKLNEKKKTDDDENDDGRPSSSSALFKVPDLPTSSKKAVGSATAAASGLPPRKQQPKLKKVSSSFGASLSRQLRKQKFIDEENEEDSMLMLNGCSSKKLKTDNDRENEQETDKEEKEQQEVVEKKQPEAKQNKKTEEEEVVVKANTTNQENDDIEATLLCSICNEIMHDCISLQPCLHSYCSGCYSEWMVKSDECPICRLKVERISKNHIVNNLISAYLKANPQKRRSDDDLKRLDEKNKISKDMLYPKNVKKKKKKENNNNDDENDEEDSSGDDSNSDRGSLFDSPAEDEEEDDDEEDDYYGVPAAAAAFNRPLAMRNNNYFNPPVFGLPQLNNFNQPFRFTCRQCPQNAWFFPAAVAPHPAAAAPHPGFVCPPHQNHLLCQCCLEAMPDRSNDRLHNPLIPKQNCSMCFKAFCDLYWGCRKGGCKRCLTKFIDLKLDNNINNNNNNNNNNQFLNTLINENQYESMLFSDWLNRKNKTLQQVFDECVQKLKDGDYTAGTMKSDETLDRVVCRECGLSLVRELAYQYRCEIPDEDLFNNASRGRPDCHWGKNCRTQKHNLEHAKRYNHICDQIKR